MFDKIRQFFFGKSASDIYWEKFAEWLLEQPAGTSVYIGTIVRTPQKAMELAAQQEKSPCLHVNLKSRGGVINCEDCGQTRPQ